MRRRISKTRVNVGRLVAHWSAHLGVIVALTAISLPTLAGGGAGGGGRRQTSVPWLPPAVVIALQCLVLGMFLYQQQRSAQRRESTHEPESTPPVTR